MSNALRQNSVFASDWRACAVIGSETPACALTAANSSGPSSRCRIVVCAWACNGATSNAAMRPDQVYHSDPETMSGVPVFVGTRVPVHTLIDHLASGVSLDGFLEDFPSVARDQAVAFLALSEEALVGQDA